MMPVLPFLEDTPENVSAIVEQTAAHGGSYILPWFGTSMREGSREYFYAQLDRLFPGVRRVGQGGEPGQVHFEVTDKALDGLYFMIGEEERKIRSNPIGASSASAVPQMRRCDSVCPIQVPIAS